MFDVCLLGTGGMMPIPGRWLSSLLIKCNGKMILVDCGEGTQIPLRMAAWGFKAIEAILLTHYHADHIAGLPGLLLTIANSGKVEVLTLIGPPGLKQVVDGLTVISPQLPYELELIELSDINGDSTSLHNININSLPADHSLPCLAYSFELPRNRRFNAGRAKGLNIPIQYWKDLQRGISVTLENKTIRPDMVLGPLRKGIKVCYCTDTRPTEDLEEFISGADLFICEGMYGKNDELEKARQNKHMTFSEAALLAKRGNVNELWLTHYSPSLKDPEVHIEGVRAIFQKTIAGKDLQSKTIKFNDTDTEADFGK
ncbi:RNAse Z [Desulfosporosinus acidiphilus SJ4]|uniref:Ribonuclease Z n=1 Tax=Desulfosporosinus acidiphilus (strain DSM 22704 / JCM 16185 / SJ4) TaxID=646529 RepID=I4D9I9_DESAJ|nr:ribonuclease Z [Desulfosporosinus acidiphilus]AFM42463.1 RNAse Z [Desulfosporosinus acidiphilus SJ4]